jgi:malate dehydrogenase (quinone)
MATEAAGANDSPALTNEIRRMTSQALHLPYLEVPADLVPAAKAPAPKAKAGHNLNAEEQAL